CMSQSLIPAAPVLSSPPTPSQGGGRSGIWGVRGRHKHWRNRRGTQWTEKEMGIWGATQNLRVREADSTLSSPPSLQFQFRGMWSKTYGYEQGKDHEVTLFPGEEITQISRKHSTYVFQLIFSTNYGRIFFFGQPAWESFNAVPLEQGNVLAFVTGHHNGVGIMGIGMHWHHACLLVLNAYAQVPIPRRIPSD
uniref:Jacalin-type lectin domain-containing protein n=1 Tax=Chelonoidis abingdonii TaxID=106734 RepID=A0A8C0FZQ5_CHEAB